MPFDPGFGIHPLLDPMGFAYDADVFGPTPENRQLDAIRQSLMDPGCIGPEFVYSIAMDVGRKADREEMLRHNLLYGAVTYAKGTLGREPVRSQGHIHAVSPSCGFSTCELYEIWEGEACVYMQERAEDNPGRCFAVWAGPGEIILVPPGWAHCTIVADVRRPMSFGAWCVRDYGFEYADVRAHKGLAWFPIVEEGGLRFVPNPLYRTQTCIEKRPRLYTEFGLDPQTPIYRQFVQQPNRFSFVAQPQLARYADGKSKWDDFVP